MSEPASSPSGTAPVADAPGDDHCARDPEAVCNTLLTEWIAGNGHHMLTYQVKDNQLCNDVIECGTPHVETFEDPPTTPERPTLARDVGSNRLLESDLAIDESEVGPNPTRATHDESDVEVMWAKDPTPAKDLSREGILERLRELGLIKPNGEKLVYSLVPPVIFCIVSNKVLGPSMNLYIDTIQFIYI